MQAEGTEAAGIMEFTVEDQLAVAQDTPELTEVQGTMADMLTITTVTMDTATGADTVTVITAGAGGVAQAGDTSFLARG